MQDFNAALGEIRSLGGEIYGVVAQKQAAADAAKQAWGLDFPMLSDPQVRIGESLAQRGLLEIYVDQEFGEFVMKGPFGGRLTGPKGTGMAGGGYEAGMYQPAVIALTADFKPLFSWASVPAPTNIGGAIGRPEAADVVKAVRAGFAGDTSLVNWTDKYSSAQTGGSSGRLLNNYIRRVPPLFYLLLLANGNFLMPMGFTMDKKGGGQPDLGTPAMKAAAVAASVMASLALRRPDPRRTAAAVAAYAAYVHLVWGPMFQTVWKPWGSDPKNSLLRKRREAKL